MINSQMSAHERFIEDLAELAAGVLDRREQPALLDHLIDCPNCMAEFEELVSAAKGLLLLVLEIEPPVGFESSRSLFVGHWSCRDSCAWRRWYCAVLAVTNPGRGDRDEAIARGGDSSKFRRIVLWIFVNRRTGGITVAQWPNVALSVFIALSIARRLNIAKGTPQTSLRLISVVAILVWAAGELIQGVNPFRRILGLAVLLATISGFSLLGR